MPYKCPGAVEIDKKLRDDFRARIRQYGITAETTDPVLAVLFRTFAQQLETFYGETDRIRSALLDELISKLGIESRMARPAQTLVCFYLERGEHLIAAGTELISEAETGDRLKFLTDAPFSISGARIAFAFAYQDGSLQLVSAVEPPESLQSMHPSLEPVHVNLGPNPALYIAVENLPPGHLSRHSLFLEMAPESGTFEQALQAQTWCLINDSGELGVSGILRPKSGNAGVQLLEWLVPEKEGETPVELNEEAPLLPPGFYGPRTILFPPVPVNRRFKCRVPRAMEDSLNRIFGREAAKALAQERAWVRISTPRDTALQISIKSIMLHAVTASNVECLNQTIVFQQHGTSIPIQRENGGAANHVVAPLSIVGETGAAYIPQMEPSMQSDIGRYSIRNGRIEFRPGLHPDGRNESYANVRLWVTEGSSGNTVGPGRVRGFAKEDQIAGLRIFNPVGAAGGADQETLGDAHARFARALLSRDRIVTRADLRNAVRAFDRRILSTKFTPGVQRGPHGLQRVEHVQVLVKGDDFIDSKLELLVLKEGLKRDLAARFPMGTEVKVDVATS